MDTQNKTQRVIKFREWGEKDKQMFGSWTIEEMMSHKYVKKIDGVLMQFTGLKDKNGKEIYDGDILLFPNDDFTPENGKNSNIIGSVWYMAPVWKIKDADAEGSYDMSDWGYGETVDEFEIIGNIYENSYLLPPHRVD